MVFGFVSLDESHADVKSVKLVRPCLGVTELIYQRQRGFVIFLVLIGLTFMGPTFL